MVAEVPDQTMQGLLTTLVTLLNGYSLSVNRECQQEAIQSLLDITHLERFTATATTFDETILTLETPSTAPLTLAYQGLLAIVRTGTEAMNSVLGGLLGTLLMNFNGLVGPSGRPSPQPW